MTRESGLPGVSSAVPGAPDFHLIPSHPLPAWLHSKCQRKSGQLLYHQECGPGVFQGYDSRGFRCVWRLDRRALGPGLHGWRGGARPEDLGSGGWGLRRFVWGHGPEGPAEA